MNTLSPNSIFGNYRILRLLGQGGMADVYEVEDITNGRVVALKVLPAEFARDQERVGRFAREIRAASLLDHRSIVAVYEVGEVEGLHYYSMALLPGGDLRVRLKQGPLAPDEAVRVSKEIAGALRYAHGKGFVHRDVKPGNILFDEDGGAVLTDFGIARALGRDTRMTGTGLAIGTPHYMSPEQIRGGVVDTRSDLYSLGIVLHEMLTGRVPFDAEDAQAVGFQHLNARRPRLEWHLRAFQPLLNGLLAVRPDKRPASAGDVLKLLRAMDAEAVTAAGPREIADRSPAWPGHGARAVMVWGLGGVALGFALIAGVFYFEGNAQRPAPVGGGAVFSSSKSVPSQTQPSRPEAGSPTDWLSSPSSETPVAAAAPVPAPDSSPASRSVNTAFVGGRYADPQVRATMSRLSALTQSSAVVWLPVIGTVEETTELLARASGSSITRRLVEGTAIEAHIEALRVLSSDLNRALDTLDAIPHDLLEVETELARYQQDPRPENLRPLRQSIDNTLTQGERIDSALELTERSLADMRRRFRLIVERGAQGPIGEAFFRSALDSQRKLADGIDQVRSDREALRSYLADVRSLQGRLITGLTEPMDSVQ